MNLFIWHCVLKLILGWSGGCKYFAEQTLNMFFLFLSAKDWLANSYYSVSLKRGGSFSACWKSWVAWCQNCIHAMVLPTCPFCNSQSEFSFPPSKFPLDSPSLHIIQRVLSFLPFLFGISLLIYPQSLGISVGSAKGKSQVRTQEHRWYFKISVEEPDPRGGTRSHTVLLPAEVNREPEEGYPGHLLEAMRQ